MTDLSPVEGGVAAVPVFTLPEWNDLTNEQRTSICRMAEDISDEDGFYVAGQCALEIYNFIRTSVRLELPPLIAPFHTTAAQASATSPSGGCLR